MPSNKSFYYKYQRYLYRRHCRFWACHLRQRTNLPLLPLRNSWVNSLHALLIASFVAPEVINIHDMKTTYEAICDIYSLGLIFYILLTGKPAFNGRSYNTIVQQNKEAKISFKLQVFDIVAPLGIPII